MGWTNWWRAKASGRTVLFGLASTLVCNVLFARYHGVLEAVAPGLGTPDLLPLVGGAELRALLEALGPAGREAYRPIANVDMVYPLAYGTFMLLTLAWGLAERLETSRWWRAVLLLPAVGVLADYVENVAARFIVDGWPQVSEGIASVWVYAHALKWLSLGPCFVLTLFAIFLALVRARVAKRDAASTGERPQ